ncbi:MAG: hypothetical protein JOY65_02830 [Acetobacteraceae bacterium]|nr:hypothetical protein [Acetobacteraceae bacterium]
MFEHPACFPLLDIATLLAMVEVRQQDRRATGSSCAWNYASVLLLRHDFLISRFMFSETHAIITRVLLGKFSSP